MAVISTKETQSQTIGIIAILLKLFMSFCINDVIVIKSRLVAASTTIGEYCQYETFRPLCSENEVIFIRRALYGRTRVGRCVKSDFGYVGCYSDVLDLLDKKCSGKRTCEFPVTDPNFENRKPCNEEFKNYLEVDFSCIRVVTPSLFCTVDMSKSNSDAIYLRGGETSFRSTDVSCGSTKMPLRVWAPTGKKMNVTLIDFHFSTVYYTAQQQQQQQQQQHQHKHHLLASSPAVAASAGGIVDDDVSPRTSCVAYGYVKDDASDKVNDVCGGQRRVTTVFTSTTNNLDVVFTTNKNNAHNYLLVIQVTGCSNPSFGLGIKWTRTDDTIDACCGDCSQLWKLYCKDSRWTGFVGNCTLANSHARSSLSSDLSRAGDTSLLPTEIALVIVLSVALTICLSIIAVGLFLIKSKKLTRSTLFSLTSRQQSKRSNQSRDSKRLYQSRDEDPRHSEPSPLFIELPTEDANMKLLATDVGTSSVTQTITPHKCNPTCVCNCESFNIDSDNDVYVTSREERRRKTTTLRLEPVCVYHLHEYVDNAVQTSNEING